MQFISIIVGLLVIAILIFAGVYALINEYISNKENTVPRFQYKTVQDSNGNEVTVVTDLKDVDTSNDKE